MVGLLIAIAFLAALGTAHAQNATWGTSPGTSNWNTATNWTPQTVPNSSSATATFNAAAGSSPSVSLSGGPFTVGTLNLNNDVNGGFSFADGTLQLAGQATINVQSHSQSVFHGEYPSWSLKPGSFPGSSRVRYASSGLLLLPQSWMDRRGNPT